MKRFFICICAILFIAIGSCQAQNPAEATIKALFENFSEYEGAEGVEVSPFMMKLMRGFIKNDKDVSDEQRAFFERVNRMMIVEMSECSAQDKARFKQKVQSVEIKGFAKIEKPGDVNAITFYQMLDDKVNIIVTAIFEEGSCSFSVFEGKFDEAFAQEFASGDGHSPVRKVATTE